MYRIIYTKQANKDAKLLTGAGLDKKTKSLIQILEENPFQNPPQYEALVGSLAGFFSRRINIQHRLVYQVIPEVEEKHAIKYQGIVKIIRMWSHYDNIK